MGENVACTTSDCRSRAVVNWTSGGETSISASFARGSRLGQLQRTFNSGECSFTDAAAFAGAAALTGAAIFGRGARFRLVGRRWGDGERARESSYQEPRHTPSTYEPTATSITSPHSVGWLRFPPSTGGSVPDAFPVYLSVAAWAFCLASNRNCSNRVSRFAAALGASFFATLAGAGVGRLGRRRQRLIDPQLRPAPRCAAPARRFR